MPLQRKLKPIVHKFILYNSLLSHMNIKLIYVTAELENYVIFHTLVSHEN